MHILVIILGIIIAIRNLSSFNNLYSSNSNKKKAENNASKLANDFNNAEVESDDTIKATSEELAALSHYYPIIINEPITIIEIVSDEVQISTLTKDGHLSELMLTISDAKIETPFAFPSMLQEGVDSVSDSFGDISNLRLALIDDKFYLLSIGLLSLVEKHRQIAPEIKKLKRDRELEKQTREISANKIHGKIDNLPISVISERDATENENWHFDPSGQGILYAIVMMAIFSLVPINDKEWGGLYLAIFTITLIVGFILWYRSNIAKRKIFKVTKLRGQFHELEVNDYACYLHTYDDKKEGKTTFTFPDGWQASNDLPLLQEVTFEVLSGSNDIVSIGDLHSLENNFETIPPSRKYYPWMLITLVVFIINLAIGTNPQQLKLVPQMLLAPTAIEINTIQDWSTIQAGQLLTAKNINRQCTLPNESIEPNKKWIHLCAQFNILNKTPKTDLTTSSAPILENLKIINKDLRFPSISDYAYALLIMQNNLANRNLSPNNYQIPEEQDNIARYNRKIISNWANWIDKNIANDDFHPWIKTKLLSMWDELDGKCVTDCWNKILKSNLEDKPGVSYNKRMNLDIFEREISNYTKEQLKILLTQWRDILNQANSNIQITTIGENTPHHFWDELINLYLNDDSKRANTNEIISLIEKTTEELRQMTSFNIDSAVVSSIKHNDSGTEIVLDLTMTNDVYIKNLIRIVLLLIVILFGLWITRKELHPSAVNEKEST